MLKLKVVLSLLSAVAIAQSEKLMNIHLKKQHHTSDDMDQYIGQRQWQTDQTQQVTLKSKFSNRISYTSELYLGDDPQLSELVFDTGSGWLIVTTTSCSSCESKVYNPAKSSKSKMLERVPKTLKYGSATVMGQSYLDKVCLNEIVCADNFQFLAITVQTGIKGFDGILGLAPDQESNGPSYVAKLKESKVIDKKQVGLYIASDVDGSVMSFGGYDKEMLKSCSDNDGCGVHWYDLTGKNWWQIEIQDIVFDESSILGSSTSKAIVDSGTSMITVPRDVFSKFKSTLDTSYSSEDISCDDQDMMCFYQGECKDYYSKFKHLKIQLGDRWVFTIPPQDYLVDQTIQGKQFCFFGVFGHDSNLVILGDAFLRTYYTVYDFDGDQVGVALHKYSLGTLEKKFPVWIIVMIVILGIFIILLIAYLIYRRYKNKKLKRIGGGTSGNDRKNSQLLRNQRQSGNMEQTEQLVDKRGLSGENNTSIQSLDQQDHNL
ncbi:eukaryotic aspartyl protease family protein [Stylonychia lemnae]|uniref:Eukaryotic aspartyl protease family protein n=1 Tax=Stylonychia lemnae TaxID=5949 RepID=A0A078AR34_STYLE|nr:eukaryotic aspartyl protease family protein [Stylonychia lemnae]|eukprot:CDW83707.1 eukaryotic aspartyl protease family protein [Stylonychia lemnae]